jgi:hypothetical protein
MANYCKQCSEDLFGKDSKDFAGLVSVGCPLVEVVCEGCGPTTVDYNGKCVGSCDRHDVTLKQSRGCLVPVILILLIFAYVVVTLLWR